jgi:hypothetical protein
MSFYLVEYESLRFAITTAEVMRDSVDAKGLKAREDRLA